MNTRLLLLALCMLSVAHLFGKIKNGYEAGLQRSKASLIRLNALLRETPHLTHAERKRIKSEVKRLVSFISYYELTEELLEQLWRVSPAIYNEIDTITDKRGRSTDVYVKVIPKEKSRVPLVAASFFSRSTVDKDASFSEYGDHSVSVNIWMVHNALMLLCHELGHVAYVIPNLATYSEYYARHYHDPDDQLHYIGHKPSDESGKSANTFVRRFVKDRIAYKDSWGVKPANTVALMERIERKNRLLKDDRARETVAATAEW